MKFSNLAMLAALAVGVGATVGQSQTRQAKVRGAVSGVVPSAAPAFSVNREAGFVMRVLNAASEDRLFNVAASVAFYALLSIVPTLAAGVSLFGLFADPRALTHAPDFLAKILPAEAISLVQGEATRLASQPAPTLSFKLAISLALSLWSASAAVRAMFDALNVVENVEEGRSIVRLYATAMAVTLGGVVVLLIAGTMIGANPGFVALGPFTQETVFLYAMLRWPLFFAVAVATIAALYRLGPCVRPAGYFRLLPGAAFAAFLWAAGSSAFGWYVATMANYTATYGSLATIASLMTWLWLSSAIVLLGAQINHEIVNRAR